MVVSELSSPEEGEIDVEIEEELFDHTYILSSLKAKEQVGISKDRITNNKIIYINSLFFL